MLLRVSKIVAKCVKDVEKAVGLSLFGPTGCFIQHICFGVKSSLLVLD
jgi:hypothetical protein